VPTAYPTDSPTTSPTTCSLCDDTCDDTLVNSERTACVHCDGNNVHLVPFSGQTTSLPSVLDIIQLVNAIVSNSSTTRIDTCGDLINDDTLNVQDVNQLVNHIVIDASSNADQLAHVVENANNNCWFPALNECGASRRLSDKSIQNPAMTPVSPVQNLLSSVYAMTSHKVQKNTQDLNENFKPTKAHLVGTIYATNHKKICITIENVNVPVHAMQFNYNELNARYDTHSANYNVLGSNVGMIGPKIAAVFNMNGVGTQPINNRIEDYICMVFEDDIPENGKITNVVIADQNSNNIAGSQHTLQTRSLTNAALSPISPITNMIASVFAMPMPIHNSKRRLSGNNTAWLNAVIKADDNSQVCVSVENIPPTENVSGLQFTASTSGVSLTGATISSVDHSVSTNNATNLVLIFSPTSATFTVSSNRIADVVCLEFDANVNTLHQLTAVSIGNAGGVELLADDVQDGKTFVMGTLSPTVSPTLSPTASPTTPSPTVSPTLSPTASPTTPSPTASPTTPSPTASPTTEGVFTFTEKTFFKEDQSDPDPFERMLCLTIQTPDNLPYAGFSIAFDFNVANLFLSEFALNKSGLHELPSPDFGAFPLKGLYTSVTQTIRTGYYDPPSAQTDLKHVLNVAWGRYTQIPSDTDDVICMTVNEYVHSLVVTLTQSSCYVLDTEENVTTHIELDVQNFTYSSFNSTTLQNALPPNATANISGNNSELNLQIHTSSHVDAFKLYNSFIEEKTPAEVAYYVGLDPGANVTGISSSFKDVSDNYVSAYLSDKCGPQS
jgi:hypothetical protein